MNVVVDAVNAVPEARAGWREAAHRGNAELAAALAAEVNDGPTPMLRPLPVDLEELASVLEDDPVNGGGRIDLRTGEVWPHFVVDGSRAVREVRRRAARRHRRRGGRRRRRLALVVGGPAGLA